MKRFRLSIIVNVLLLAVLLWVIIYECYPARRERKLLKPSMPTSINYQQLSTNLPRLSAKLKNNEGILFCAFGDSVTHGVTQMGVFDFDNVYHSRLKQLLERYCPNTVFNVINAGVDGDTSFDGLKRIEQDVLRFNPDLILIEFGLNDCPRGLEGIGDFKNNIQKMIDEIKADIASDIILLTPNFMATSDNPNVSEEHRKRNFVELLSKLQNTDVLSAYAMAIREIGHANNIPVADVYAKWEVLSNKINTNVLLSNGLNHPNQEGHLLTAYTIMETIAPNVVFDFSFIEKSVQDPKSNPAN